MSYKYRKFSKVCHNKVPFGFLELCEEIVSDSYCSGDIALLKVLQKFNDGLWSNLKLPGEEFSVMLPGILVCSVSNLLNFVNI